jgi:hypothetical protein
MKKARTLMRIQRLVILCSLVICCLVLTCLPGCSKTKRVTVKGRVTFANQPLTAGTVAYVAADGRTGTGIIQPNGSYIVNDAPVGDTTITVVTPPRPMGPMNMAQPPAGNKGMPKEMLPPGYEQGKAVNVVPAPPKYAKVEESPLKFTVQPGSQDHDIELTP